MTIELEILGEIIREERDRRQLSQENLAALSGLSRTFLGEVERGDKSLAFVSLIAIAQGLNIQPSQILQEFERRVAGQRKSRQRK